MHGYYTAIRKEAQLQIERDKLTKEYIGRDLNSNDLEIIPCRRERCGSSYRLVCDFYPNFWMQGDIAEHGLEVVRCSNSGEWMIAVW